MKLGEFDLNLLWSLYALLEEKSVTRAADRVGIGQPAMSSALARLRRNFNDELIVRSRNQNHLTPLAKRLAPDVARLILSIDSVVEQRMDFNPDTDARSFNVSADDYSAAILAPVFRKVLAHAPSVAIHISRPSAGSEEVLFAEGIDLLISTRAIPSLPSEILFTDRNLLAASTENAHVGDQVTEDVYDALPHLRPEEDPEAAPACALGPASRLTTSCYLIIPFLVRFGGLAYFPERLACREEWPSLRFFEPPVELPEITTRMYWHPQLSGYPHNIWLRSQLRVHTADL